MRAGADARGTHNLEPRDLNYIGRSASAAGAHEAGPAGMICQTLPVSEGMPAVAEVLVVGG